MNDVDQALRQAAVSVWKVADLLSNERLRIPDYQRPYTWGARSVWELVDDIRTFTPQGDYRIGTVILHSHGEPGNEVLDVVDGQQRLTTLHLLARTLRAAGSDQAARELAPLQLSPFGTEQTLRRVRENAELLERLILGWQKADNVRAFADAVFHQCEVVVVTLSDLDEAFQMFDSQNARGRPLYPTDLLKAFHLREIGNEARDAAMKREVVELWEDMPPAHVNALFGEYLFRIRRWSSGREVPTTGFTAEHVGMFKGIREGDVTNRENHWARPFLYAKNFTDDYRAENSTLVRFGMLPPIDYPHQIDQPILNGETFFRMAAHYYRLGVHLGLLAFGDDKVTGDLLAERGQSRSAATAELDKRSESNSQRSRYAYIRGLLDALLLYYRDRFGDQERDRFASLAARYVMVLRAESYAVRRESINGLALGTRAKGGAKVGEGFSLFQEIRDAATVRDVLSRDVPRPNLYGEPPNDEDKRVVSSLWGSRKGATR